MSGLSLRRLPCYVLVGDSASHKWKGYSVQLITSAPAQAQNRPKPQDDSQRRTLGALELRSPAVVEVGLPQRLVPPSLANNV